MTTTTGANPTPADRLQTRTYQERRLAWANSTRQLNQQQQHPLVETPTQTGSTTVLMSRHSFTGLILAVMHDDPECDVQWETTGRGARWEYFKGVENATQQVARYCGISPHLVECLERMSQDGHATRRELDEILLAAPYHVYE